MRDSNLSVLNKFIDLYQQLIRHDGYGDIEVKIRKVQGKDKEVVLLCGKEYRYQVTLDKRLQRYKAISVRDNWHAYSGPERRTGKSRRNNMRRQQQGAPRNFRLERRLTGDRRKVCGRRRDD